MSQEKKIYFISDLHLGVPGKYSSKEREIRVCKFLESISDQIEHLYLLGDIFDYWYEYREVVPKGNVRWLGMLARLTDKGVPITAFTGNHDIWLDDYLTSELDIPIIRNPYKVAHFGHQLLLAHGDGLGPGDKGYKVMKKVFTNSICQWLFSRLHPNFSLWLMRSLSHTSRKYGDDEGEFIPENEWLVAYSEEEIKKEAFDYLVFGHRHLPIVHQLSNGKSTYINIGDWLNFESYGVLDADGMKVLYYENPKGKIYG